MIARTLCPVVVGREAELSELEDLLLGSLRGEGGVALLIGEAGMGKTRLTGELRRRAERLSCEVMSGACSEAELALPYLPFIEAIGNHITGADLENIRAGLGAGAIELGRLFPQLASPGNVPEAGDPAQAKLRLYEAMIALLTLVARPRGLLLIVEDIHWADPSTREVLDYMTRRLRASNVMVLATLRSDELHRKHPLLPLIQGWRRAGNVVTVELAPLSPEAVGQMISATFDGDEVGDEFRDFMMLRSEGNPFVIEEMLKAALDRGDIFHTASGWDRKALKDLVIPRSVKDAILQRVERLEPDQAGVLRAASVLGRQFTYEQLAALAQVDKPAVTATIQTGVTQQLLADAPGAPGAYRFRHALTREAVYEDMLLWQRQELHALAAELLQATGACSADVAFHLFAGGQATQAVPIAFQAAVEAGASGAHRDAAGWYERALPHVTDPIERARILCRLGEMLVYSGESTRARGYLEEGLEAFGAAGDVHEVAGYRLTLGRSFWDANQPGRALEEYETVRDALINLGPSRELALAYVRLAASHTFDNEAMPAQAAAEEAIRVAEASGAEDVRVWAYNFLGGSLVNQGLVEEGLEQLDRSYQGATRLGLAFIATNAIYNDMWMRNQLLRTDKQEERMIRYRAALPTLYNEMGRSYCEALMLLTFGELRRAEELAHRSRTVSETLGHPKMVWRASIALAHTLLEQDQLGEASDALPPISSRVELQDTTYDGLVRGRLLGQRPDEREVADFIDGIVENAARLAVFPGSLLAAVELLLGRGDVERASAIAQAAEHVPDSARVPYVPHMLGLVELARGNGTAAIEALEAARFGYQAVRAPVEEARALTALAEARHTIGDAAGVAADLGVAAAIARSHGAGLVQRLVGENAVRLDVDLGDAAVPESTPVIESSTAVGEKMVSILFVDVRGYTAMTRASTPADMADRIATLQRWATQEVTRRGGVVDKFAGDAVMATFNISGATVDHALDALRAAIAIRDKAALLELPVGAGIAVGSAVVGRLSTDANVSVLGNTTNLASRLQAQAGPGEVVLSDEVFRRCRAWLEERGLTPSQEDIELKGFDSPVAAFRLRARTAVAAAP